MKGIFRFGVLLTWLFILPLFAHAQVPIFFQDGVWLKFKVTENGIYHITYNDLRKAGINPDDIKPSFFQMLAFPPGMLPQKNVLDIPENIPVSIKVTGQSDNKFDNGDEIIFYGQGPDRYSFDDATQKFVYENNIYSDANYYFLRVATSPGARVVSTNYTPSGSTAVNTFYGYGYYESDLYNDQKSGRQWFGEQFDAKTEITIRFEMPGIVANSDINFVSSLMTQSYQYAFFKMAWNNIIFFDKRMDTIPQTTYGPKGSIDLTTSVIKANAVSAPSVTNQDIKINFTKGGGNRSAGYLDYILFTLQRKIAMYDNFNTIHIPHTGGAAEFEVSSFPDDGVVWDVTDPFSPVELQGMDVGTKRFSYQSDVTRTFVLFNNAAVKSPAFVENISSGIDRSETSLLIVAHPDFVADANRLAAHRKATYGIDARVVTTQQIYNEFSGGRQDVSAIRNYVRYIYEKYPGKLRNLLLFGRGSYDYKDRVFNNSNYVPIYESRNSLDPLLTYSSDDYYGFLEMGEGEWLETQSSDHTLDIGVGRLPVSDTKQAANVVDKLIAYDRKSEQSLWKQRVLFVADDGDWNIHQQQAEDLAELFEVLYKNYHTSKLYLDAFEQESIAAGQISPKAKAALAAELNKGYDIVNYTGHGSERVWMQERILDQDTPLGMRNDTRLPVFLTATCEFGRHDDPILTSTAEMLLVKKGGGAIGLVTTARPVNTITNSVLNKAFYAAYFENTVEMKDLGYVFRQTKNKSMSGVANRNFSLLGDPSMRFDTPKEDAVITSIQTSDGSDVLKALSKVTLMGEVRRNGNLSTTFNGTIDVEVFDRRSALVTKGDENTPFNYKMWDHSLFRGKASVVKGEFALEFVVPEGIPADIQEGKIVLYAYNVDHSREAEGTLQHLEVGGTAEDPVADVTGPTIELFMGDSTFVNGGFANSNTFLVGKLYDKSGINISGYGDTAMKATLDGDKTFIVSDYFTASTDDFTTGWFSFPISDLEEGLHTIMLSATDTYGNVSVANVSFIVGENGKLIVEDLYAYPNPFSETNPATIEFKHNRAGEDLEVQVVIYDVLGQLADKREFIVSASKYKVTLFDWGGLSAGGTKMTNGLYLVKLVIRSVSDGAKNDKIARLILTN